MTSGKNSILRKNTFLYKLLCVCIAIALALLLIPSGSIKAVAEDVNTAEEASQATEQTTEAAIGDQETEGTTEVQEFEGIEDATDEEKATDSDSENLQANEVLKTNDANNDNQNLNADNPVNVGGTVTIDFDTAAGMELYELKGADWWQVEKKQTLTNVTNVEITHFQQYNYDVLQITKQDTVDANTIILYKGHTSDRIHGKFLNKDTGDFLSEGYTQTLSEGDTLNFVTTLPSTVNINETLGGTIVAEDTAKQIAYGATYHHNDYSNTLSFTYGGEENPVTLAQYKAQPDSGYAHTDFWAATDAAGTNKLEDNATIKSDNIYLFATFDAGHNITLDYKSGEPSSVEKLKSYGWSYDTETHIASQAFIEGTSIDGVFATGSKVWSKECEPVLYGHTCMWSPTRSGTLSKDFNSTALYIPIQEEIKAVANPVPAATMSITPTSYVNYGDKVADVTDTSITIKRGTKEIATITYTLEKQYMLAKWTAKDTSTGYPIEIETLKEEGITSDVTFTAQFVPAGTVSVTYDKSTVKGNTTEKLEAAGWTAEESYLTSTVTYYKMFPKGSYIEDAVDSFNSVEGVRFEKTDTTYQKAIYKGQSTKIETDIILEPIFTFKLAADSPKTGTGTLDWDWLIAEVVENVNFVHAYYVAIEENGYHYVKFIDAKYFDPYTETIKTLEHLI